MHRTSQDATDVRDASQERRVLLQAWSGVHNNLSEKAGERRSMDKLGHGTGEASGEGTPYSIELWPPPSLSLNGFSLGIAWLWNMRQAHGICDWLGLLD